MSNEVKWPRRDILLGGAGLVGAAAMGGTAIAQRPIDTGGHAPTGTPALLVGRGIAEADTSRGRVAGYEQDGILAFKGIPYAASTADHRFQPSRPPEPWAGVRSCPPLRAHLSARQG